MQLMEERFLRITEHDKANAFLGGGHHQVTEPRWSARVVDRLASAAGAIAFGRHADMLRGLLVNAAR